MRLAERDHVIDKLYFQLFINEREIRSNFYMKLALRRPGESVFLFRARSVSGRVFRVGVDGNGDWMTEEVVELQV